MFSMSPLSKPWIDRGSKLSDSLRLVTLSTCWSRGHHRGIWWAFTVATAEPRCSSTNQANNTHVILSNINPEALLSALILISLAQSRIIYPPPFFYLLESITIHILFPPPSILPSFLPFIHQHKLANPGNSFDVWVFDSWVWLYIWAHWEQVKGLETMGDGTSGGRRITFPLQGNWGEIITGSSHEAGGASGRGAGGASPWGASGQSGILEDAESLTSSHKFPFLGSHSFP